MVWETIKVREEARDTEELSLKVLKTAAVLSILLSGAFAGLAFYSPVKSLPTDPRFTVCTATGGDGGLAGSKVCQVAMAEYETELPPLLLPFWKFQSYEDLSVSFLALSVLIIAAPVILQKMPMRRRIAVPRVVSDLALLVSISGLLTFSVCAFMDIVSTNPTDTPNPLILGRLLGSSWTYYLDHYLLSGQPNLEAFGKIALLAFAVSISGAFVHKLEGGVSLAFARTMTMFAAPVLVVFETALLLFTPVNMPIHISALLVGTPVADVLTNWFVLIISSGVLAVGVALRSPKHWRANTE